MGLIALFAASQAPRPLEDDQLTLATIALKRSTPELYPSDPVWSGDGPMVPWNAGALLIMALERSQSSLEIGAAVGIVVLFAAFLISAFWALGKECGDPRLAVLLAFLASIRIDGFGATFWGLDDPRSFLTRTVYLPLVPLLLRGALDLLETPSSSRSGRLFFLLGLSSLIHQVSSLYLALALGVTLALGHLRSSPRAVLAGVAGYLLGMLPALLILLAARPASTEIFTAASSLAEVQAAIELRYAWAMRVPMPWTILLWAMGTQWLVALPLLILRWGEDQRMRWLGRLALALSATAYLPYLAQHALLAWTGQPFVFVELWRGLRFLPYLGCLVVALAWGPLLARSLRPGWWWGLATSITAAALIASISVRLHKRAPSPDTCRDPIYEVVRALPERALILENRDPELRYCGRRSLFASFEDGALAFYSGRGPLLAWLERHRMGRAFFDTPSPEALAPLRARGVTHVLFRDESPTVRGLEPVATRGRSTLLRVLPSGGTDTMPPP